MKTKKINTRSKSVELARAFPSCYLSAENMVYNIMSQTAADYNGGSWDFYKTENGVLYMVPDDTYFMSFENYYEAQLSQQMIGLIITFFVLNRLSWAAHSKGNASLTDYLVNKQDALKCYIGTLSDTEQSQFFRAID